MQEKMPAEFLFVLACKKTAPDTVFADLGVHFWIRVGIYFQHKKCVFCLHVFSSMLVSLLGAVGGRGGSRLDMKIMLEILSRPAIPFGGAANYKLRLCRRPLFSDVQ